MTDEQFRLPGSSYEELAKIVMGYGRFDHEVVPSDIGKIIGVHETQVSRNNAFLVTTGIVTGGKKKAITPTGKALARALEHQMPEEITKHWRAVIADVPFFRNLLAAVRIRRGMDESSLQSHVAYSAGVTKTPHVMAGAAAVIDIMRAAGVLHEDGGKLVVAEEGAEATETQETTGIPSSSTLFAPTVSVAPASGPFVATTSRAPLSIHLEVSVQCTLAELDTLGEKLRNLIEQVTKQSGGPQE